MFVQESRKIIILTTIADDWGGSEELWARAIPWLQKADISITVLKASINYNHREFKNLAAKGVLLKGMDSIPYRLFHRKLFRTILSMAGLKDRFRSSEQIAYFNYYLKAQKPDLVLISQGLNFEGLRYGKLCKEYNIPYILISQKAVDFFWPPAGKRFWMRDVYKNSALSLFVSNHNKRLTEEQFGIRLPNAEVIFNPVKVPKKRIPFPSVTGGYKLACIGRFFLIEKGQDIILRIMSKPEWQNRPLSVSFIGAGEDLQVLKEMADLLNVANVSFHEYTEDILSVWRDHHALILSSRCEGMPLVLLEAMALGRPAIISDEGGSAEMVIEGETGFIGKANEVSFEIAMQRAWDKRDEWESIGENALNALYERIPVKPEKILADRIKTFL